MRSPPLSMHSAWRLYCLLPPSCACMRHHEGWHLGCRLPTVSDPERGARRKETARIVMGITCQPHTQSVLVGAKHSFVSTSCSLSQHNCNNELLCRVFLDTVYAWLDVAHLQMANDCLQVDAVDQRTRSYDCVARGTKLLTTIIEKQHATTSPSYMRLLLLIIT